jgi:uncharacterized protein (DUF2336 family)
MPANHVRKCGILLTSLSKATALLRKDAAGIKRALTATMNEAQLSGTTAAAQSVAMGMQPLARPRVSAASFRDLTARLRKTEVPSIIPELAVASPPPALVPEHVPALEPVIAPMQLSAVAPKVESIQPAVVEAFVPPAPVVEVAVVTPMSAPMAVEPTIVVSEAPVAPNIDAWATPVEPAIDIQPVILPTIDVQPSIQPVVEAEPQAAAPVEEAAVANSVEPASEVVATSPETPADEFKAKEDQANEGLKEQIKSRQVQAQLDLTWRMLLATPSSDERAAYLQEVERLSGIRRDPMPTPAPEHDLSAIEPSDVMPMEVEVEADEPVGEITFIAEDDPTAVESSELARSLLDMMATGSNSGLPQERALAADTLLRLAPKLDTKSLVMLSQRVARMDNPPHLLVARLIRDPRVEVSGPLLEDCPQITDKDLESVVAENDVPRMRMIARRRSLGHAITDALIKSGDASVMLTLVRNSECEISQDGFLRLIEAAGSNVDLLAPLCTRADMPAPLAFELFWHAPAQLRRFILTRFLTDSETLTKILRITMSTNELDSVVEHEGSLQHAIVEALERAARGRIEPAADELGAALKIDPATAMRVLRDKQGEPLAVLLKTAGYPRQALPGLLARFADPEIGLIDGERDIEELVSIFETMSFNKARILLTYWDWAQRRTGPYAPLQ